MGKTLSIEDRLALDRYHVDEEHSHIQVELENIDENAFKKLVLACPAGCYTYIDGQAGFSHLGCLECGTCRVLCGGSIVKEWNHPASGVGVSFRQG